MLARTRPVRSYPAGRGQEDEGDVTGWLLLARVNLVFARVYSGLDVRFDFHGGPPFLRFLSEDGWS